MTTLNAGSRPHHPINTGTIWTRGEKLPAVTFQMDVHLWEAFVLLGEKKKKAGMLFSQVHSSVFCRGIEFSYTGQRADVSESMMLILFFFFSAEVST